VLLLLGALFFVSGVSALIYQVAWQRILALHSGVGIYSVALIVAAFLAGLGLGSYAGGVLSGRVGSRRALFIFAWLELGIGAFALLSCSLYYDLLYVRLAALYASPWSAGLLHFLALLVPTTVMGMSLPFLVRASVADPATASKTIGFLYGINVAGAGLGALLAPWVLMRLFGVTGAVLFGAAGNLLAGVGVLALGASGRRVRTLDAPSPPPADPVGEPPGSRPFSLWVALYALSGFCALALEIVWFRVIDVAVKSTAFTFGTVLSVFLFGLALGSLVGGPLALRVRSPLRAFLTCQCALLLVTAVSFLLLAGLPVGLPVYRELVEYWGAYNEFQLGREWRSGAIFGLYGALPLLLYGVPTVLMGLSFAILQRAVHDERQTTGRKVGFLQAANILGNVAGSLLTGLVLLTLFGTMGSLRALLGVGLVFAAVGVLAYGPRWRFTLLGGLLLLAMIALPDGRSFWLRLHGRTGGPALIDEDATAVAAITPGDWVGILRVSVNGKGHSWLPFGRIGLHSQLGALPAVVHPAPEEIAIIGLGSGDTAWAAACRRETRRLTVFELGAPEQRLLEDLAARPGFLELGEFMEDPRIDIVTADGRIALAQGERRYDVIEADALRPHSGYAGNLYSVEFFRLCARKLKPGGLMCTWSPTPRVYLGFIEAFAHVVELDGGQVLLGSNEPITIDTEAWRARLREAPLAEYLGELVTSKVDTSLTTALAADPGPRARLSPNRDLFPRDEFSTPYPAGYSGPGETD
jgi:MFS family permease